jgi:hypothetical protein
MRQNRSSKWTSTYERRIRPGEIGLRILFAVTLGLALLSVSVSPVKETVLAKESAKGETSHITAGKAEAAWEKSKGARATEPKQPKTQIMTSKNGDPAEKINPAELPKTQVLSGSAVYEKGRQIKWQVVCTGGNCGAGNVTYLLGELGDRYMCGTVGQTAVGPGTSPSYEMNSGFWQHFLGGFLRGDANGDGIINLEDVIYLVNYLYKGGLSPSPLEAGNCNCDEVLDVGDVIFLINYLLKDGPRPSC